jgi:hypothetical protein
LPRSAAIPIVGPIIGGVTAVVVAFTSPKLALMVGAYSSCSISSRRTCWCRRSWRPRRRQPVTVMAALLIGGAL